MGNTAQHSVTSHYTAYSSAEAKIFKHISTNLQYKQINNGQICFSREIQENYPKENRRYEHQ